MIEPLRNTSPTFHKGAAIAAIGLSLVAILWAPVPVSELDKVRNLGMELVHFDVAMPKEIPLDDTDPHNTLLLKRWANETPQKQTADWQKALSWLR